MAYITPWNKPGCTVLERFTEPTRSGSAKGIRNMVKYRDPKGKIRVVVHSVKWSN